LLKSYTNKLTLPCLTFKATIVSTILLGLLLVLLRPGSALAAQQAVPTFNTQQIAIDNTTSLKGSWAFKWGEWIPLQQIHDQQADFNVVTLPNFLFDIVDNKGGSKPRFVYGYGTYFAKLTNLDKVFTQPAINMRSINDAWQAWWIDPQGQGHFLGESGKIATNREDQQVRYRPEIINLPVAAEGTLVIYLSAFIYDRAGVYGELQVVEKHAAIKTLFNDLLARTAIIAIGLLVVLQNLVFYIQRPKEKNLLLLAIFAFVVLCRAILASDYFYYFLEYPAIYPWITKLEYLLVIWPAVAGIHMFAEIFPTKHSAKVVRFAYVVMILVALFTAVTPLQQMMLYLPFYQGTLIVFGLYVLILIVGGVIHSPKQALPLALGMLPLFMAVINDIIATQTSDYNVFVAEYALFIFLFVQTQLQVSRFVTALDTSEHLTNNLQLEVARKTIELEDRNKLLQEKADYLEAQHDKIKILSETDHLTGLCNRQTLDKHCQRAFEYSLANDRHFSLVILDLDDFKLINDKYGHLVGDECLKTAAHFLLQGQIRKDDMVARFGGEEIVIVLNDSDIETSLRIAQQLCDGLSQQVIMCEGESLQITASIGIAERKYNQAADSEALFRLADQALYAAKSKGKNCVEVAPL
jgi:diguanylate cyclase (GGDEF)-like protein